MDVLGLLRFKESISGESLLPAQVGESGLDRAQVRGRHAHLVDDVGGRWHGRLGAYDRQAWVASEVEQRRLRLHRRPQQPPDPQGHARRHHPATADSRQHRNGNPRQCQ
jgi:hypothetical protein